MDLELELFGDVKEKTSSNAIKINITSNVLFWSQQIHLLYKKAKHKILCYVAAMQAVVRHLFPLAHHQQH